jgi:tetratricopeptide (TPR) repeat protein
MKFKVLSITVLSLLIVGCTGGGGRSGGFSGSYPTRDIAIEGEKLTKTKITLTDNSPTEILDELSRDIKTNKSRTKIKSTDIISTSSYIGENLYIPLSENESSAKMISSPKNSSYDLKKLSTNLIFRSVYEGNFVVNVKATDKERRITISNVTKYDFSENDLYAIIKKTYENKSFDKLKDGVALYKIVFPNGKYTKENSMKLLELAGIQKNERYVRSEYNYIRKYSSFNSSDREIVAKALAATKVSDVGIDNILLVYSASEKEINTNVAEVLLIKPDVTKKEIEFLEKVFNDNEDVRIAKYVETWYSKNDPNKTPSGGFTGSTTENYNAFKELYAKGEASLRSGKYNEALGYFKDALAINKNYSETNKLYFYLGQSNYSAGKYQSAVSDYKKALNVEKSFEKQAEIYYNIGVAAHKAGNVADCKNYMTYIQQNYAGTIWSQRSIAYLSSIQ